MDSIPFLKRPDRIKQMLATLAGIGFLGALAWILAPLRSAESKLLEVNSRPAQNLQAGQETYTANCARCHGPTGAGDGRDAALMDPKPRHLSDGLFKFRTTASGSPPTDEDLFHTITNGLPGSRMPDFQRLPEEARWQLVYFVKSLSPIFEEMEPEPIGLGTDPGRDGANLATGKEAYTKLGCAACHGNLGRGNGPSAPTLVDDWDQPIQASDLTQGWNYRGGQSPKEIMTRLMTGLDGTPMPSYAEATTPEEAWQLAYFVHSLQEKPNFGREIAADKVEGPLPENPEDPRWQTAPRTDLRLSSNFYQDQKILPTAVHAISAQALYNEREISFLLRWHDRSENKTAPPDGVKVALLADRKLKWEMGSLRSWPATSKDPSLNLLSWSAGQTGSFEAVTRGTAELEKGKTSKQALWTVSHYDDGEWTLLLKRRLQPSVAQGVKLAPKKRFLIGFMVWDGGNQESGRHRANSNWIDLVLNK